jgi:hypothetical protein
MIFYEKKFNLSFSFVFRHFREISKDFSDFKLSLSEKFSSLVIAADLVDRILIARERFLSIEENFIFSALTSASSIPQSSDIFTKNSETITSNESLIMSKFVEQSDLSNQDRSNIVSFTDFTTRSMFSATQRSKIADIVIAAVRTIQMQQLISSLTSGTQAAVQSLEFIKK